MFELLIVDWGRRLHHFIEGGTIPVRWPDFEAIFLMPAKRLTICDEWFETGSRHCSAYSGNLGMYGVEHELKRRESLLTVNNRPLLEVAGCCG
jgi:hypothetical protein